MSAPQRRRGRRLRKRSYFVVVVVVAVVVVGIRIVVGTGVTVVVVVGTGVTVVVVIVVVVAVRTTAAAIGGTSGSARFCSFELLVLLFTKELFVVVITRVLPHTVSVLEVEIIDFVVGRFAGFPGCRERCFEPFLRDP